LQAVSLVRIEKSTLDQLILDWIVDDHQAFLAVENPQFRAVMSAAWGDDWTLSHKTVGNKINTSLLCNELIVKTALQSVRGTVLLTK
jgi:hypothetical protein